MEENNSGTSLIDTLNKINEKLDEQPKKKKIKIPRRAKVRRGKIKKGWIGVLKIDENGNISGEKTRMAGNVLVTKDGITHASDGREILFWEGKFPIVMQPSWKDNPVNLRKDVEKNETYGQQYIKAKMLKDALVVKPKGGGGAIIWILIIGALLFGANYMFGGGV